MEDVMWEAAVLIAAIVLANAVGVVATRRLAFWSPRTAIMLAVAAQLAVLLLYLCWPMPFWTFFALSCAAQLMARLSAVASELLRGFILKVFVRIQTGETRHRV